MTKISIFKNEDLIFGYQIKGHSGYAEEGSDIVCSAVSVAGQMTLTGLVEVLNLKVESIIEDGFMQVLLSKEDSKQSNVQVVLETMEKTLKDISKQYSKFVSMEVRKDVY